MGKGDEWRVHRMGRGYEGRELTSLKSEKILGGYLMSTSEKFLKGNVSFFVLILKLKIVKMIKFGRNISPKLEE